MDIWISFGDQGLEYKLQKPRKSFSDAKSICINNGGKMAKIVNSEMANAFRQGFNNSNYMTDLNDIQEGICAVIREIHTYIHK